MSSENSKEDEMKILDELTLSIMNLALRATTIEDVLFEKGIISKDDYILKLDSLSKRIFSSKEFNDKVEELQKLVKDKSNTLN